MRVSALIFVRGLGKYLYTNAWLACITYLVQFRRVLVVCTVSCVVCNLQHSPAVCTPCKLDLVGTQAHDGVAAFDDSH
jgi:hypothetical protein